MFWPVDKKYFPTSPFGKLPNDCILWLKAKKIQNIKIYANELILISEEFQSS